MTTIKRRKWQKFASRMFKLKFHVISTMSVDHDSDK